MLKDDDLDLKRWEVEAELRKLGIPFTSEEDLLLLKKRYKNALNAQWLAKAACTKVIRRRKQHSSSAAAD